MITFVKFWKWLLYLPITCFVFLKPGKGLVNKKYLFSSILWMKSVIGPLHVSYLNRNITTFSFRPSNPRCFLQCSGNFHGNVTVLSIPSNTWFSDALAMANEFLLTKSEVELSFDFSHLKMLISQNWYEKYILELHINFVPQTDRGNIGWENVEEPVSPVS